MMFSLSQTIVNSKEVTGMQHSTLLRKITRGSHVQRIEKSSLDTLHMLKYGNI